MKLMFRVSWRSLITGATGHGKWFDNRSQVEELVEKANAKFPDLKHWVESLEDAL